MMSNERPSEHLMLPVLIEEDLTTEHTQEPQRNLLDKIQGQLQDLIDYKKEICEELLEQLLRQRRILVIVDNLSGMREATRQMIHPDSPNFCINALVVTSRLDETLGNTKRTTLHPHRIQGNRLSSFMDDYLTHLGKRDNLNDIEFFDACKQISKMVGTRDINVLLVKLFAELIENKIQNTTDLPRNIPDLMLKYLKQINQDVLAESRLDDRSVRDYAKILAWECLEEKLTPIPIARTKALEALGNDGEKRLEYLKNLNIIQNIGLEEDQICFVLDPFAEYLAGLHLLKLYGNNQQCWDELLNRVADTEKYPQKSIQGFLLALRDCYLAKKQQANIPETVAKQLENLPLLSDK